MICPICNERQKHLNWWACKKCMKEMTKEQQFDMLMERYDKKHYQEALF